MKRSHPKCLSLLLLVYFLLPLTGKAIDKAALQGLTTDDRYSANYKGMEVSSAPYTLRHNPFARAFEHGKPTVNGYPATADATVSGEMVLKAILFDDKHPLVNVNGHVLSLGEQFDGHTLKEVSRDAAVFFKQGRATRLELEQDTENEQLLVGDDSY